MVEWMTSGEWELKPAADQTQSKSFIGVFRLESPCLVKIYVPEGYTLEASKNNQGELQDDGQRDPVDSEMFCSGSSLARIRKPGL